MNIIRKLNSLLDDAFNKNYKNVGRQYICEFYNSTTDEDVKNIYMEETKGNFKNLDDIKQYLNCTIEFEKDKIYFYFDSSKQVPKGYLDTYNRYLHLIKYFFPVYDQTFKKPRAYLSCDNNDRVVELFEKGLCMFTSIVPKQNTYINRYKADLKVIQDAFANSERLNKFSPDAIRKELKNVNYFSWDIFYLNLSLSQEKLVEEKRIEQATSMELPTDWYNSFMDDENTKTVSADNSQDGLVLSLNNLGYVDIEYISQITGRSLVDVIKDLQGVIYQNPERWDECFYKGWETSDEYLSGNIYQKYCTAVEANKKYKGYFDLNVKVLSKNLPTKPVSSDIYITLGSPWIPVKVIRDFIIDTFKMPFNVQAKYKYVTYNSDYGIWEITNLWKNYYTFQNYVSLGTSRITGIAILEHTLNSKTITVYDYAKVGKKTTRTLNKNETLLAKKKQEELVKVFREWLDNHPSIRKELIDIYTQMYCSNVIRQYDGSYLTMPNMNKAVELRDYQKNVIARILNSPCTLLAHDVGAGKTYAMIGASMEKKRLGLSQKNMFVVPNNIVGQWGEMFKHMYNDANILLVDPKSFVPSKREEILKKMRDNDYDAIIIAYSSFSLIPLSKKFYVDNIKLELEKIGKRLSEIRKSSTEYAKKYGKLKQHKEILEEQLKKVDNAIYFDQLGITGLFVDEAHNFKNLQIEATNNTISGATSGSSKCQDLYDKMRSIQRTCPNSTIVFATGTPITNSLTDIFVMQKYLQEGELRFLNLQNFDSWIGMFAEKKIKFEIDVDTNNYRMVSRYDKFHNIPELSSLLSMITDFYQIDNKAGLPNVDGYSDVVIKKSQELKDFLARISERADLIRNHKIDRKTDNMLKITTDGRKAALDIRLIDDKLPFSIDSKVYFCAENVYNIYQQTNNERSTQIIFCDSSTPKKEFNVYDSLKDTLVSMGIPQSEIVYAHDYETEREKNKLYKDLREGKVRIIIGSTPKLGLGVNIQDKLIALHHLDIPWRPSDMIQREGRILRCGNENDKVYIYRYITDGSFDAYSWQLLENKQRIIKEILSGSISKRKCDELDEVILNYSEVKALAVGNPLLKERVELSNELSKYSVLQKKAIQNKHKLEIELLNMPNLIARQEEIIQNRMLDIEFYNANKRKYSPEERIEIRKQIHDVLLNNEFNTSEIYICDYNGFDIVLPTNSTYEKLRVIVRKNGEYHIDMKETEVGMLIRLDNFFDNLEKMLEKDKVMLEEYMLEEANIKQELSKEEDYSDYIIQLQENLRNIDERLGVNLND